MAVIGYFLGNDGVVILSFPSSMRPSVLRNKLPKTLRFIEATGWPHLHRVRPAPGANMSSSEVLEVLRGLLPNVAFKAARDPWTFL